MTSNGIPKEMISMDYEKNIKVIHGIFKLPSPSQGWTITNEFTTTDDCKFSIWMRSTKTCDDSLTDAHTVNIVMKKNRWEPAAASVSISFGEWKETSISENWTCSLDFPEMKLSSENCHDYYLTIIFNHFEFLRRMDKPRQSNLYNHLPKFWIDSIFSDVTIIVGDEKIKAHKLILASQSPVFLKLFENLAEKSEECLIFIENIEPTVMKEVLAFLYSGCDDYRHSVDMILNIMRVAYKYEIQNLYKSCQYRLFEKMTINNVLKIVDIADDYNAKELCKYCLSFMRRHKEKIILMNDFIPLARKKINLFIDFTVGIINTP